MTLLEKCCQPSLELNKDGSVHGRIIFNWGESPYCSTYCKHHVAWVLAKGWDIIPYHNPELCAGFECGHGIVRVSVSNK